MRYTTTAGMKGKVHERQIQFPTRNIMQSTYKSSEVMLLEAAPPMIVQQKRGALGNAKDQEKGDKSENGSQ